MAVAVDESVRHECNVSTTIYRSASVTSHGPAVPDIQRRLCRPTAPGDSSDFVVHGNVLCLEPRYPSMKVELDHDVRPET